MRLRVELRARWRAWGVIAMLIGVVLLLAGAIVNAVGIRNAQAKKADVAVESGTAGEVAAARE